MGPPLDTLGPGDIGVCRVLIMPDSVSPCVRCEGTGEEYATCHTMADRGFKKIRCRADHHDVFECVDCHGYGFLGIVAQPAVW